MSVPRADRPDIRVKRLASPATKESGPRHAAVIDVGSNSVRLVVYRIDGRAIWTLFNEKVVAGLGRDLPLTGALAPDGVAVAITALKRFAALIAATNPRAVYAVATAAVREARDGPEFVRRVRAETGLSLEVLTGPSEARFSALGVLAGAPASGGLVADLGGASLELARLASKGPRGGLSLPLGPFSLMEKSRFAGAGARQRIEAALAPLAPRWRSEALNAVGGAWRSLALLHMKLADYRLEIVHQYRLSRREALELCQFVLQQSRGSLERIEGLSKRRVETLPHAALVLESLFRLFALQTVTFSAFGLREGLLLEAMPEVTRRLDPLVEGCRALAAGGEPIEGWDEALANWLAAPFATLEPLFACRDAELVRAAAALADLGARLHPDHRADLVFDQVLRAPIPGMDHRERAFLAVAAFSRHTASNTVRAPDVIARLLDADRLQRARALGAAVRLGCDLSGRTAVLLARARLDFQPGRVLLRAEPEYAPMLLGEQTAKRAATLADRLDRDLSIQPLPARSAA